MGTKYLIAFKRKAAVFKIERASIALYFAGTEFECFIDFNARIVFSKFSMTGEM